MPAKLHKEILTRKQAELLRVVKVFNKNFRLVGGTAIALHIGHRRSIDFDLFTNKSFRNSDLRKKIKPFRQIDKEIVDRPGNLLFCATELNLHFTSISIIWNTKKILTM